MQKKKFPRITNEQHTSELCVDVETMHSVLTWLLKRLKGHSIMNVLTGSKHCWIQHRTAITLFSRKFEVNWVGKILL